MRFNALLLALVLVGTAVCVQAGPVIHLARSECELGEVWYGDTKTCQVGVTNKGDTDLEIGEVHTSCGCTRAEVERRTLQPGQTTMLTISFDATGIAAGRKTQTAFIRSNDPERAEASVRVFTTVVQQIQVEPLRVIGRIKTFDERLSFPMRVANVSDRSVTLAVASSRGSVTDAAIKPDAVPVEAGQSAAFTLEARLSGAGGSKFYRGAVILKSTHPKEHTIVVPVFIRVEEGS